MATAEFILNASATASFGAQKAGKKTVPVKSVRVVKHGDHTCLAFYTNKADKRADATLSKKSATRLRFRLNEEQAETLGLEKGRYIAQEFDRHAWEVRARWARKPEYQAAAPRWLKLVRVQDGQEIPQGESFVTVN